MQRFEALHQEVAKLLLEKDGPTPARVAAAWLRTPSAVTVAMTTPRPTAWP